MGPEGVFFLFFFTKKKKKLSVTLKILKMFLYDLLHENSINCEFY